MVKLNFLQDFEVGNWSKVINRTYCWKSIWSKCSSYYLIISKSWSVLDEMWNKLKANTQFFKEESLKRVDETKRLNGPNTISTFFPSMDGSFKNLSIDWNVYVGIEQPRELAPSLDPYFVLRNISSKKFILASSHVESIKQKIRFIVICCVWCHV